MKSATIYEAHDGTQFKTKEECARYEADHVESRLVGLTADDIRSALEYCDIGLAHAIEKIGGLCAKARREAGDLRRRPSSGELVEAPVSGKTREAAE